MIEKIKKYYKTNKKQFYWITIVALLLLSLLGKEILTLVLSPGGRANAAGFYHVDIDDDADLLNEEEEAALWAQMSELTAYGNMVFATTYSYDENTAKHAQRIYKSRYGHTPGAILLIDAYHREIWVAATGSAKRMLTSAVCYEITDRTYPYASDGDYYACAHATFDRMGEVLRGGFLLPGLRIVISLCLSLILALVINLWRVFASRKYVPQTENLPNLYGIYRKRGTKKEIYQSRKKRYYESSDSGGDSFSGGGGGGGGFSGGGHSF
ncbi:MAG: TPM domain-containing protein [Lachnospiraceae bacterium]|nr:TPM domain-containing protein [Lachnospiraceae bacterium]